MVVGAHRQGAGLARTGAELGSGRFADPVRHQNPRRILPDRAVRCWRIRAEFDL